VNAAKNSIRLVIGSNFKEVPLIGLAINRLCLSKGFSEMDVFAMELCAVEAVTNAIEHAYKGAPGHKIQVDLGFHEDRMVLEVSDRGMPMDSRLLREADCRKLRCGCTSVHNIPERGRGLAIIKETMDSATYETTKGINCLKMVKKISVRAISPVSLDDPGSVRGPG
jgi:serine/threonine-protein kinase RsbW